MIEVLSLTVRVEARWTTSWSEGPQGITGRSLVSLVTFSTKTALQSTDHYRLSLFLDPPAISVWKV